MTEEEDEDFYVRYYVVRAFRVSFFLSLSLVLSSFVRLRDLHFSHRETMCRLNAFVSLRLSVFLCDSDG